MHCNIQQGIKMGEGKGRGSRESVLGGLTEPSPDRGAAWAQIYIRRLNGHVMCKMRVCGVDMW